MTGPAPSWVQHVTRVVVLTGAGISTGSGIPDYRGPGGVWTRDPAAAAAFTYDAFTGDVAVRARFWQSYLGHPAWDAVPNPAHEAIARMDRRGVAVRVLTQNIDGLHQRAGLPARKVLELHGSMNETACLGCGVRVPAGEVLARVASGQTDPRCLACGGILKLATVLFGERLDPAVMSQAVVIASASPLMLAIGSSRVVESAASLCRVAVERGANLVIVNRDQTPCDNIAAEVIRADIQQAVPQIVDLLTRAVPVSR